MKAYQLVVHTQDDGCLKENCKNAHWVIDSEGIKNQIDENRAVNHTDNAAYNQSTIGMVILSANITKDLYSTAVRVAADILHRHKWGIERMIQHSDVLNCEMCKCPNSLVLNWKQFRSDVNEQLGNIS